jgi:hypothetical protein
MCYIVEVYYPPPPNDKREAALAASASEFGGRAGFREVGNENGSGSICLTYEFDDVAQANCAAEALRDRGEHVEGPVEYTVERQTGD